MSSREEKDKAKEENEEEGHLTTQSRFKIRSGGCSQFLHFLLLTDGTVLLSAQKFLQSFVSLV